MSQQKNTISINGKVVDAKTGAILKPAAPRYKTPTPTSSPRVLDGFFKGATKVNVAQKTNKAAHAVGRSAKAIHQKTQHSTTLLRAAVKKPLPRKNIIQKEDEKYFNRRPTLERAKQVNKSGRISKFGGFSTPSIVKKTAALPVKKAPDTSRTAHAQIAALPVQQKVAPDLDALLTEALHKASSHEQKHKSRRKFFNRRTAGFASVAAITILLGGFFAFQNAASVSVKLAAARANVHSSVPGYSPSGFSLSRTVNYEKGKITLNFSSNSDARAYQIIEQASSWNSETLYSSFVSVNQRQSQTITDKGKTIYLYDGGNATWVDGGVWYQIVGNTSLSSNQLLKVAASM